MRVWRRWIAAGETLSTFCMVHVGCRHIIRVTIVVQLLHTSDKETKSVLDRLVNTCVKISSGNLCILLVCDRFLCYNRGQMWPVQLAEKDDTLVRSSVKILIIDKHCCRLSNAPSAIVRQNNVLAQITYTL